MSWEKDWFHDRGGVVFAGRQNGSFWLKVVGQHQDLQSQDVFDQDVLVLERNAGRLLS